MKKLIILLVLLSIGWGWTLRCPAGRSYQCQTKQTWTVGFGRNHRTVNFVVCACYPGYRR